MNRWVNHWIGLIAAAALGAAVALGAAAAQTSASPSAAPHDPYRRTKNGPPLQNIFHKVNPERLFQMLAQPKHYPAARMPDFQFSQEEVLDIMAYLKSIGDPPTPAPVSWPAWADKKFDALSDQESEAVFALAEEGKKVWSSARCSICHTIHGPGGSLIGGYVDLRAGGIDLQIAGVKLQRDWLYRWLQDPKRYFPDTLMPRFRFSEAELRALTEYILRDEVFRPASPEAEEPRDFGGVLASGNPERISRGKRLMVLSRCVLCHDIKGISELLPPSARPQPPQPGSFEFLAYDLRCLSCHSFAGQGGTYAPELASEGSRLQKDWLARYLQTPDIIRPLSQQMPKLNLTEEEAALVASYMEKSGRDARIPENIPGGRPVTPAEIERGRALYKVKGCFACHSIGEGAGGVVGPTLETVGTRLQSGYIWYHLKNPHAVNPYSAEPDYGLTDEEARALAAYLSSKKPSQGHFQQGASVGRRHPLLLPPRMGPVFVDGAAGQELIHRRDQARQDFLASPKGIYLHYCAACHGDDGKGEGRLWSTELSPKPADLTVLRADKGTLLKWIRDDPPAVAKSNLCPPWGRTIPPEKIERLAQYLLSLAGQSQASPAQPAASAGVVAQPMPWFLMVLILAELALLARILFKRRKVREESGIPRASAPLALRRILVALDGELWLRRLRNVRDGATKKGRRL